MLIAVLCFDAVLQVTGKVFVFMCHNNSRVMLSESSDDGVTWTAGPHF